MSDPTQAPTQTPRKDGNGFGVTALVVGIIAVLLAFIPFVSVVGIVLGGIALIFAIIGLVAKQRPRGMAIAGLVLSIGAIVIGLIFTIAIYGAVSAIDDAVQESEDNRKPHAVEVGKAFTHDIWKGQAGWKITNGGPLDMVQVKGLRVKNTGDSPDNAFLTFNLNKGDEVLASIECSSSEVQPGKTIKLSCIADEAPDRKWDSVSVRGEF